MGEQMNILKIRTVIENTSKASQVSVIIPFVPPHGIKLAKPGSKHTLDGHLETFLINKPTSLNSLQRLLDAGDIRLHYFKVLPDGTVAPLLQVETATTSTAVPPAASQPAHEEGAVVTATTAPSELIQEVAPVAVETPVEDVTIALVPDALEDTSAVEALIQTATEELVEPSAEPVVDAPKKRKGRKQKEAQTTQPSATASEDVLGEDSL